MTNKLFTSILIIAIAVVSVRPNINKCKTMSRFLKDHGSDIITSFDFSEFLGETLPERKKNVGELIWSGGGTFGRVYKIKLKPKYEAFAGLDVSVDAAMKVIRYDPVKDIDEINTELMVLQEIAPSYPLQLLQYHSCVRSEGLYPTLFIFTEHLTHDLLAREFKNKFRSSKLSIRLGIMLNMAYAVRIFHDRNLGHFDIKPNNFLSRDHETHPIIKLIDYGMVDSFGLSFTCGTRNYKDPNMAEDNYVLTPESDIFSLGITFHELFLHAGDVDIEDKNYFKHDLAYALNLARERNDKLFNKHKDFVERTDKIYKRELVNPANNGLIIEETPERVKEVTDLIETMIALNKEHRPTIGQVIKTLENIIISMSCMNPYLMSNQKNLNEIVYGTHTFNTNIPNVEDLSHDEFLALEEAQKKGDKFVNEEPKTHPKLNFNIIQPIANRATASNYVLNSKTLNDVNNKAIVPKHDFKPPATLNDVGFTISEEKRIMDANKKDVAPNDSAVWGHDQIKAKDAINNPVIKENKLHQLNAKFQKISLQLRDNEKQGGQPPTQIMVSTGQMVNTKFMPKYNDPKIIPTTAYLLQQQQAQLAKPSITKPMLGNIHKLVL